MSSTGDLRTAARIRTAAIALFGEGGYHRTTVRAIADRAGVSAGLVLHHFGSKDALRVACDDWVMKRIVDEKSPLISGGGLPNLAALLAEDGDEIATVMRYVVTSLRDGGAIAEQIFNRMCTVTEEMTQSGVDAGLIRRSVDLEAQAALVVAFGAGLMMLDGLFSRRLGDSLLDAPVYNRYVAASMEFFTHPYFTDDRFEREIRAQHEETSPTETSPTKEQQ